MESSPRCMLPHTESTGHGKIGKKYPGETDKEYRIRRDKNNEAVKKSREISKQRAKDTEHQVNFLNQENCRLEERIRIFRKELEEYKDVFLQHAANGEVSTDIDIEALLQESYDLVKLETQPK